MLVIPLAGVRQNFLLVFKISVSNASQRLFSSLKVILMLFPLSHSRKGASHHLSISELPCASFSCGKKISQPFLSVCTKGKHMSERNLWKPNKRNFWCTEDSFKSRQAQSLRKQQGKGLLYMDQG